MRHLLAGLLLLLINNAFCASKDLRIGFNTWAGYAAITVAKEKGFLANEGIDAQLVQHPSLNSVREAFAAKKIDVMLSTSNEVILLANRGEKLKMILVADYSNGADTIVAQQDITSIAALKNKHIGVVEGTISNFLLLKALQQANLTEKDVTLVNVKEDEAIKQFAEKKLAAITTWSPFSETAVKAGGHIIFSSSQIPYQIVDVMSVRENIINESPLIINKLARAYFKTLKWVQANPKEAKKIMSKTIGTNVESLDNALKGIKITGLKDNLEAFGTSMEPGTLYPATQDLINFLLQKNVIKNSFEAKEIIYPYAIWNISNS